MCSYKEVKFAAAEVTAKGANPKYIQSENRLPWLHSNFICGFVPRCISPALTPILMVKFGSRPQILMVKFGSRPLIDQCI